MMDTMDYMDGMGCESKAEEVKQDISEQKEWQKNELVQGKFCEGGVCVWESQRTCMCNESDSYLRRNYRRCAQFKPDTKGRNLNKVNGQMCGNCRFYDIIRRVCACWKRGNSLGNIMWSDGKSCSYWQDGDVGSIPYKRILESAGENGKT